MTKIYGIKNCDTMKKALNWLEEQSIDYEFHDYKTSLIDPSILKKAIHVYGWEVVINKRGTTWRKLPDDIKAKMNADRAVEIGLNHPSIIKRPILVHKEQIHVGFSADKYIRIFELD